jgi:hypothetical protein
MKTNRNAEFFNLSANLDLCVPGKSQQLSVTYCEAPGLGTVQRLLCLLEEGSSHSVTLCTAACYVT